MLKNKKTKKTLSEWKGKEKKSFFFPYLLNTTIRFIYCKIFEPLENAKKINKKLKQRKERRKTEKN